MNSLPSYLWYSTARAVIHGLADIYGKPYECVAGIMAALSQRMHWQRNVRLCEQVLALGTCRAGLPLARGRALRILAGEHPNKVLRGDKVRAFYRALCGDDNACVLDVHMLRYLKAPNKPTPKQYKRYAQRLRREAHIACMPVATYQAIVWCNQRGRS